MKKLLRQRNFIHIKSIKNDPLNTVWLATKPIEDFDYAYSDIDTNFYNEIEDFNYNYHLVP